MYSWPSAAGAPARVRLIFVSLKIDRGKDKLYTGIKEVASKLTPKDASKREPCDFFASLGHCLETDDASTVARLRSICEVVAWGVASMRGFNLDRFRGPINYSLLVLMIALCLTKMLVRVVCFKSFRCNTVT